MSMKKVRIIQLLIAAIVLLFVGCKQEKEPIAVTGVSLSHTTLNMTEGESQILTATVSPSNADNKSVSWTSSNSSVASVQEGVVTAHKAGSTIITVKTADGGKTATCSVTVTAKNIAVTGVSLDKTSIELTEGDELTLTATVNPDNATNKNVTWSSSDNTIASVSSGKVTALKAGKATITVQTADGGKTATCEVTVNAKVYPVTGVTLDKTSATLTEGDELTLTATVNPDNATNKNITWSSSDNTVASVSNGKVTALKAGKATITVQTADGGKTATCEVTVKEKVYPVESVSLDKTSLELTEGDEATLTATVSPDNASNKNVAWTSSNPEVATVENGKVTAVKAGTATITVKTEDGGKTAMSNVTVKEPPYASKLTLDATSINAYIYKDHDKYYEVNVTAIPSNAVTDYEWSSSNPKVAKIEGDGSSAKIYTEDYGESIISVLDRRSGVSASMNIHTIVENFQWNETSAETMYGYPLITIMVGDNYKLSYSYTPAHATNIFSDLSQFVFYENDVVVEAPSFISIDKDGNILGLKEGTVGIKPTGLVSGSGRVYVKVKVPYVPTAGLELNKSSLHLLQYDSEYLQATITPGNATNKNVVWSSSNPAVAKVDQQGKVTAVSAGTTTITAVAEDGGYEARCQVGVQADSYEAVDLGLSVKWASHNLAADSAYETGGYYLYGDPTGTNYYPYFTPPSLNDISGTQYDIVRQKWGGNWRIPTGDEFDELFSECSWTYTTKGGVNGMLVIGPNGNSIFLPHTGYGMPDDGPVGTVSISSKNNGYYMTSDSYADSYGRFVYVYKFSSYADYSLPSYNALFAQFVIRPVRSHCYGLTGNDSSEGNTENMGDSEYDW